MNFEEQNKNLGEITKQLDSLMKLQNEAYSKLPTEVYEKVKEHHIDANKMIEKIKKGDFNSIDELVNKYIKK